MSEAIEQDDELAADLARVAARQAAEKAARVARVSGTPAPLPTTPAPAPSAPASAQAAPDPDEDEPTFYARSPSHWFKIAPTEELHRLRGLSFVAQAVHYRLRWLCACTPGAAVYEDAATMALVAGGPKQFRRYMAELEKAGLAKRRLSGRWTSSGLARELRETEQRIAASSGAGKARQAKSKYSKQTRSTGAEQGATTVATTVAEQTKDSYNPLPLRGDGSNGRKPRDNTQRIDLAHFFGIEHSPGQWRRRKPSEMIRWHGINRIEPGKPGSGIAPDLVASVLADLDAGRRPW